ncbi:MULTISPECIES: hypothetical protein [unclassified Marinobacter]|uniref:hypothetical protein n=1 Tax=unclassified Marinobacter TaxID=83889 RepID=UPI0019290327|nr:MULTISPECIES: hypothetical protein [unclassified Marinobacter]MBL3825117.1 hypothetical protein [Marinobacter sp. MC3]MBL3893679.1 hypothetical protein [Marinobacter sp. MW3]
MSKLDEMVEYFAEFGFEHICYQAGKTYVYGDLRGAYVHLHPEESRVEITTVDGIIHSTTGLLSFPNHNIPVFLRRIDRHRPAGDL